MLRQLATSEDQWEPYQALHLSSGTDPSGAVWRVIGQLILKNPASGKCVDDPAFSTTNGKALILYTCNGGSNQRWVATVVGGAKYPVSPKPPITSTGSGASSTGSPTSTSSASTASGLLRPYGLGLAPYNYISWSGSLTSSKSASGVGTYFAASLQSAGGCTPAWDGNSTLGLNSSRGNAILSDLNSLRAAGGSAVFSFGERPVLN